MGPSVSVVMYSNTLGAKVGCAVHPGQTTVLTMCERVGAVNPWKVQPLRYDCASWQMHISLVHERCANIVCARVYSRGCTASSACRQPAAAGAEVVYRTSRTAYKQEQQQQICTKLASSNSRRPDTTSVLSKGACQQPDGQQHHSIHKASDNAICVLY